MSILSSFTSPIKFLGASVRSATHAGGNGGSHLTLTVDLVEDPKAGDHFSPPPVWHPVTFEAGAMKFRGILQNHLRQDDFQGYPAYRVVVADPAQILEGVAVITADVADPVDTPNVLNVYGYWEDRLNFGGSLANDLGMLWDGRWPDLGLTPDDVVVEDPLPLGLKPGLEILANQDSPFSGGINFRGRRYGLDLSGLPRVPEPFRLGGGAPVIGLMQLVADLCDAAGADVQIILGDDDVIRFQSLSRNRPMAPGVLAHWAGMQPDVQSKSIGVELVSETANVLLRGGLVRTLNQIYGYDSEVIWPYWGLDADGNTIWGEGVPEESHTFTLPCDAVADAVGSTSYPCSIAELRAAAVDMDSWAAYLVRREPEKAELLNVASAIDRDSDMAALFGDLVFRRDLLSTRKKDAELFGAMNEGDYWSHKVQGLYDFVASYAREYMGRKFLVRIPFWIYWKVVPDQFGYVATDEIESEGGYMAEDSFPLGLPYAEVDKFMTGDGRFGCFVAFPLDERMNLARLSPENYTVVGDTVYMKAEAEPGIFYAPGRVFPYAVVTLAEPIFAVPPDPLGGIEDVADMLGMTPEQVRSMAGYRTSSFPVRIHPPCYRPAAVALPTKSNRKRYGSERWLAGDGTGGPAQVLIDEDLTPWTCGDVASMLAAGEASIKSMTTGRMEIETAELTIVDLPRCSIREALVEGGPAVTSIDLSISTNGGVLTSYSMRTYTPSPWSFSRYNAERIKVMGRNARMMRANVRNLYQRRRERQMAQLRAYSGLMENTSRAVAQRSPHECLMGFMVKGGPDDRYRTAVAMGSPEELLANMRADSREYRNFAGMGLEGLLRPISTNFHPETHPETPPEGEEQGGYGDDYGLPHFEEPHEDVRSDRKLLTTKDMNPFKDSDVDLMVSGREYAGNLHRKKGEVDQDDLRPLVLRGPLAVNGWGLEMTGKPVPNADQFDGEGNERPVHEWSDEFLEDHTQRPERWKAGVVGLVWNNWTKSWMSPGCVIAGKTIDEIGPKGEGEAYIEIALDEYSEEKMPIRNKMSITIPAGSGVFISYFPNTGEWGISGLDCPES